MAIRFSRLQLLGGGDSGGLSGLWGWSELWSWREMGSGHGVSRKSRKYLWGYCGKITTSVEGEQLFTIPPGHMHSSPCAHAGRALCGYICLGSNLIYKPNTGRD